MAKIFLVEDNKSLCLNIQDWFEHKHHKLEFMHDGLDGLAMLGCSNYDLLIFDVKIPGIDGFELCRRFRSTGGKTPVIMLTGQDKIHDKEMGFAVGADDYLTKPFHLEELYIRVQAQLRRSNSNYENALRYGEFELNHATFSARRANKALTLSRGEFALLEFFMRNPRSIFSPEALLSHVWQTDSEPSSETVRTSIKRLRKKIDNHGQPSVIKNIHGVGYCFDL